MVLDDLVVCPTCHHVLDGVDCPGCGSSYRRIGDVYDLTPRPLPEDLGERADLWEQVQDNGERAYNAAPELNLAVGDRADARRFGEFLAAEGVVLDIGCGPQTFPAYAHGFEGRLVGIDPLVGAQPRRFDFAVALAEYLPFADGTFDTAVFATSLDHLLDPRRGLQEAVRVVGDDGHVVLWIDDEEPSSALRRWMDTSSTLIRQRRFGQLARLAAGKAGIKRLSPYRYMDDMEVPAGAVDHFHLSELSHEQVFEWLAGVGLDVVEQGSDGKAGLFLRCAVAPAR